MKDNKLHSRQWALYNYLKTQTDWVTQKDIALALPSAYPCTVKEMQDFHNSACRHSITDDIRTLNNSGMIQKTILSTSKGVKIATEEEFNIYIGRLIKAAVKRLEYVKNLSKKGGRNGQYKITFGEYERDFVQAFMEE